MAETPNDYITAEDVQEGMPDTDWGADYDHFLTTFLIPAACRAIDRLQGLAPGSYQADTDEVRYFTGDGTEKLWIDTIVADPTEVAMDLVGDQATYTVVPSSDYNVWPRHAAQLGEPFYRLDMLTRSNPTYYSWYAWPDAIRITGKFGWSETVPEHVTQLAVMQVIRWFKRAQQAYEDVGAITSLGQLRYVKGIDPDLQTFTDIQPGRIAL